MFSTVLGMPRPSEKLKSHEKVDFGELLKRCNLRCFGHFRILSGPHKFAENRIFMLSNGKLKNLQRHIKTNDFGTCRTKSVLKLTPFYNPTRSFFKVQQLPNLCFTGYRRIAKTLDVIKQWFYKFHVPFWGGRAVGRKPHKRDACACFRVSETISN